VGALTRREPRWRHVEYGRPGDGASRPWRSDRRCDPQGSAEGRISPGLEPAPSSIARTSEPSRRGTKSHESWPTWQQGGPPQICSSRRSGSETGDSGESQWRRGRSSRRRKSVRDGQIELREGLGRQPASQGVGTGQRFDESRLRGPAMVGPLRGRTSSRAGRRGVPPRGGTGKTHRLNAPGRVRDGAGDWRTRAL
jgi:hypothetical protein